MVVKLVEKMGCFGEKWRMKMVLWLLLLLEWCSRWRGEWWRKWWWRKVEMVGGDGRPRREAWLAAVGCKMKEKKRK